MSGYRDWKSITIFIKMQNVEYYLDVLLELLGRELWAKLLLESLLCGYKYCMTDVLITLQLPAARFLLSLHLTLLPQKTLASWGARC